MECGKSVDTELCKQSVGKCRQIVVQTKCSKCGAFLISNGVDGVWEECGHKSCVSRV